MIAKLTLTSRCNARCVTCPCWTYDGQDMSVPDFAKLWDLLRASPVVDKIILNNVGDLYNHPEHAELLRIMRENPPHAWLAMTTNAGLWDETPPVHELVISFNGGNREGYEATTGLSFDDVSRNIRAHYDVMRRIQNVEMHCLIWDGNRESEAELLSTWKDFPGRIRVSYKYDNQGSEDHTLPEYRKEKRVECEYLHMLNVAPDCTVRMCAHDWDATERWGSVFDRPLNAFYMSPDRARKIAEHKRGVFSGVCEKCNFNVSADGAIRYIKERTA